MRSNLLAGFCAGVLWLASWSASATPSYNPMAHIGDETPLLPSFASATAKIGSDATAALIELDLLLANTPKPTPLRGLVQMARANVLMNLDRYQEAGPPLEEALRLLPEFATVKLMGANYYTFSGNPGRGADLWLEASRIDPDFVKNADEDVWTLLERLDTAREKRRAELIRARLQEIGFEKGSVENRSSQATSVIRAKLEGGDLAGAEALLAKVQAPSDAVILFSDNRYAAIWPALTDWSGARLEKVWPSYLAGLKADWNASRSLDAGLSYARALRAANQPDLIISEFLPELAQDRIKTGDDYSAVFLATAVANALADVGRTDDAIALLERLQPVWPVATNVAGLNLIGNLAVIDLRLGRYNEALAAIDETLAAAKQHEGLVNTSALVHMHVTRVCALHGLQRDAEGAESAAMAIAYQNGRPDQYLRMLQCLGRREQAKAFLISRVKSPDQRSYVLEFVQDKIPETVLPGETSVVAINDSLRRDKDVLNAIAPYGRKLPFPVAGMKPAD